MLDATDPEQLPDARTAPPDATERSSRTPGARRRHHQHRGAPGDDPAAERRGRLREWCGRTAPRQRRAHRGVRVRRRRATHSRCSHRADFPGCSGRATSAPTCCSAPSAARPARRSSSTTAAARSASTWCSAATTTGRKVVAAVNKVLATFRSTAAPWPASTNTVVDVIAGTGRPHGVLVTAHRQRLVELLKSEPSVTVLGAGEQRIRPGHPLRLRADPRLLSERCCTTSCASGSHPRCSGRARRSMSAAGARSR